MGAGWELTAPRREMCVCGGGSMCVGGWCLCVWSRREQANWDEGTEVIQSMCLRLKNSLRTSTGTCRPGVNYLQPSP